MPTNAGTDRPMILLTDHDCDNPILRRNPTVRTLNAFRNLLLLSLMALLVAACDTSGAATAVPAISGTAVTAANTALPAAATAVSVAATMVPTTGGATSILMPKTLGRST